MVLKSLFSDLVYLFYPPICIGCNKNLLQHEQHLCLNCRMNLPRTHYHLLEDNPAAERFYGKVTIKRASSFLQYGKAGLAQKIIWEIKYRSNSTLARWMGEMIGKELLAGKFFEGIDYLVPVPLHPDKERTRGYNQALLLAEGIARVTGIAVENEHLRRVRANESQTDKSVYERWENTRGIFELKNKSFFKHKHLLLIDDVLTTGATIEACARCFASTAGIEISALTLAIT